MSNVSNSSITDRDWIDCGKADAWAGKPKSPPEHDPQAASMYDLGYCEGEIERSPLDLQNLAVESDLDNSRQ